jgi:hypothetical protein
VAAGSGFSPTGRTVALTESWNCLCWRVLRTPSPGTMVSDLASVSCSGPAGCVAVGYDVNRGQPVGQPLAEQWNGNRWRVLRPPGQSHSVLAAGDG